MTRITEAMNGVWTSFVRTVAPMIVGYVVNLFASWGINVSDEFRAQLAALIGLLAGALYYVLVRVLERLRPKFGYLLGAASQPVYAAPGAVAVVEETAAVANRAAK